MDSELKESFYIYNQHFQWYEGKLEKIKKSGVTEN